MDTILITLWAYLSNCPPSRAVWPWSHESCGRLCAEPEIEDYGRTARKWLRQGRTFMCLALNSPEHFCALSYLEKLLKLKLNQNTSVPTSKFSSDILFKPLFSFSSVKSRIKIISFWCFSLTTNILGQVSV